MRQDYPSNRAFADYAGPFDEVKSGRNKLTTGQPTSIAATKSPRAT